MPSLFAQHLRLACHHNATQTSPSHNYTLKKVHPLTPSQYKQFILTCPLHRPMSILSLLPSRPTIQPSTRSTALILDSTPLSALKPTASPSTQQVRTAIRNTYNPSHRVRKRRHGFLARLHSRTGRKILKRRRKKGRVRWHRG